MDGGGGNGEERVPACGCPTKDVEVDSEAYSDDDQSDADADAETAASAVVSCCSACEDSRDMEDGNDRSASLPPLLLLLSRRKHKTP